MKILLATGQNFMAICLMPHIPYELIVRGIEYIVKSYGQVNHTEASPEMPPIHRHTINNILPELLGYLGELNGI
jgi:hypothetical protein